MITCIGLLVLCGYFAAGLLVGLFLGRLVWLCL